MTTRANTYFNSPQFAAAAQNLASMFAPPSAADEFNYARASGQRADNERLSALWDAAGGDFDRMGVASGRWNPTQSYYAVDQGEATARRGQDVAAGTARRGQDLDFTLGLPGIGSPLAHGDATVGLPPEVAEALGIGFSLPGMTGAGLGAPAAPLSQDEVMAAETQRLIEQGVLTDDMIAAMAFGNTPTNTVVGLDGPQIATVPQSLGREPVANTGSQAATQLFNYETADGSRGTAMFDPNTRTLVDSATLQPVPAGAQVFRLEGENRRDMGLGGTTSNQTEFNRVQAAAAEVGGWTDYIEGLLDSQPGAGGLAGRIQNFGQNVVQVAQELGGAMQAAGVEGVITPDALAAIEANMSQGFNPVFQQVRTAMLRLAYANARIANPSGEVGQIALQRELEALGQGMLGNDESIRAALNVSREAARIRVNSAGALLGQPVPGAPAAGPVAPTAAAPQAPAPAAPRAVNDNGEVVEWNGQEWVRVQ